MIVLIDDDKLVYLGWKLKANKTGNDLVYFSSIEGFLDKANGIPLTAQIYIDSSLGNNILGELESKKIWTLGYKNIYLTTGFSAVDFDLSQFPWIKEVFGKSPPF